MILHTVVMNTDEFSMKVGPFRVSLSVEGAPKRIRAVAEGADVPFVCEDGKVSFTCHGFEYHETYVIEF